jgi:peptidoglycan/xylan/chitin deacetylase (PgdA/CDA1 family)
MNRKLLNRLRLATAAAAVSLRGPKRLPLLALHDLLWLYPTLRRNCSWHGPILTKFHTESREVWLTIDDGPDPGDTPQILGLLEEHNARASFFVIGEKVDANRSLCRDIISAGHTLENHTHTHPAALFWSYPCCLVTREIDRCNHAIRTATGTTPRYFRPPAGLTNSCVHPSASQRWLRVAGWSACGLDGLPGQPSATVVQRIVKHTAPGKILLIHQSGCAPESRIQTLKLLLEHLSTNGYRCVIPPNSALS